MKRDLEAFSRDIVSLIETSGDTGDSGDKLEKSLRESDIFVPTHRAGVSPLVSEWGQRVSTSGGRKDKQLHKDDSCVPTVPTVATRFQQVQNRSTETGVPADWHAVVAELHRREPVEWLSVDRWMQVISDAEILLTDWGQAADRLGWTAHNLFGVHPTAPAARFDAMGLLLLIQGGTVLAMTERTATIRRSTGALLTYRRRSQAGVLLSEVQL